MTIINELVNEMEWRVSDFAKIKKLTLEHTDTLYENLLLQMSVPIIYAHWEGFVVQALSLLYEYFNNQSYKYNDLKLKVFICSVEKSFNRFKGKISFDHICQFSDEFFNSLENGVIFEKKDINTKSNLTYEVFSDLCDKLLIPTTNFTEYKPTLNQLVNVRNRIAHGENGIVISVEKRDEFISVVTDLMTSFVIEIDDYLINGMHLKIS